VKIFDRRASRVRDVLDALDRAGLKRSRVPTVLGFDPKTETLVTDEFPSTTIEDLVVHGDAIRAATLAAGWIHDTIDSGVRLGRVIDPSDSVVKIRMRTDDFCDPGLAQRVLFLLDSLDRDPPRGSRQVLIHGSMKLDHCHDCGDSVGLVDWDGYRQGPPEYDAATFLATAARIAAVTPAVGASVSRACAEFRRECADVLDPAVLSRFELLALAKAIGKLGQDPCVSHASIERLLDQAETLRGWRSPSL
jgi:Phosphotransferase enzyme family